MPNSTYEVLLKNDTESLLSRILLEFDLPFKKYPYFGTWCYFLADKSSLTIFDVGPKFKGFLGRSTKPTHNANKIIKTIRKYFPAHDIKQIILSHYHFDHSQSAPELQQQIKQEFGYTVPIRISPNDLKTKTNYLKFFNNSLEKIFLETGDLKWKIGKPLKNNEKVEKTTFSIKFAPGHTSGNIVLISHKYKVIIGGWWLKKRHTFIDKLNYILVNEDNQHLKKTKRELQSLEFKTYFHHPVI